MEISKESKEKVEISIGKLRESRDFNRKVKRKGLVWGEFLLQKRFLEKSTQK